MGYFQTMALRKIIGCIELIKVQVTNGQMGDGGPKERQPSLNC